MVNSIQASRDILQRAPYDFQKPSWFRRIIGEIAGVGLVIGEGEMHRRDRRIMAGMWERDGNRVVRWMVVGMCVVLAGC